MLPMYTYILLKKAKKKNNMTFYLMIRWTGKLAFYPGYKNDDDKEYIMERDIVNIFWQIDSLFRQLHQLKI